MCAAAAPAAAVAVPAPAPAPAPVPTPAPAALDAEANDDDEDENEDDDERSTPPASVRAATPTARSAQINQVTSQLQQQNLAPGVWRLEHQAVNGATNSAYTIDTYVLLTRVNGTLEMGVCNSSLGMSYTALANDASFDLKNLTARAEGQTYADQFCINPDVTRDFNDNTSASVNRTCSLDQYQRTALTQVSTQQVFNNVTLNLDTPTQGSRSFTDGICAQFESFTTDLGTEHFVLVQSANNNEVSFELNLTGVLSPGVYGVGNGAQSQINVRLDGANFNATSGSLNVNSASQRALDAQFQYETSQGQVLGNINTAF